MQAIALGLCRRAGQPVINRSAQPFNRDRCHGDFGEVGRIRLMKQIEQIGRGFDKICIRAQVRVTVQCTKADQPFIVASG